MTLRGDKKKKKTYVQKSYLAFNHLNLYKKMVRNILNYIKGSNNDHSR